MITTMSDKPKLVKPLSMQYNNKCSVFVVEGQ